MIHEIDSKNGMIACFSKLYGKICVEFCFNTGERFFIEV